MKLIICLFQKFIEEYLEFMGTAQDFTKVSLETDQRRTFLLA
jgi:hypothetical protein